MKQKKEQLTYEIVTHSGHQGIKCLDCNRTSWSTLDIKNLYCGGCHEFHDIKSIRKQMDKTMNKWDRIIDIYGKIIIPVYIIGMVWTLMEPLVRFFYPQYSLLFILMSLFKGAMTGTGLIYTLIYFKERKECYGK